MWLLRTLDFSQLGKKREAIINYVDYSHHFLVWTIFSTQFYASWEASIKTESLLCWCISNWWFNLRLYLLTRSVATYFGLCSQELDGKRSFRTLFGRGKGLHRRSGALSLSHTIPRFWSIYKRCMPFFWMLFSRRIHWIIFIIKQVCLKSLILN